MSTAFGVRATGPVLGSWPQLNFDIPDSLLAEVDFKWLMAGHGWHVDVARLRSDPAYAAQILGKAMASEFEALRDCAATLSKLIDQDPAAAG